MESEVKTVVCPNCGASAHNLHNCEFCGSFLVQRAAEGKDLLNYVKHASAYKSVGLEKVLKKYTEILQQHPNNFLMASVKVNDQYPLQFLPRFTFALLRGETPEEGCYGLCLYLSCNQLSKHNALARFQNSTVYSAFSILYDHQGNFGTVFLADFGWDYLGATALALQLLEDVFCIPTQETTYEIYDSFTLEEGDELVHSVTYNSHGEVIESRGAGKDEFASYDVAAPQASQAAEEEESNSVEWKKWLFWIAVGIGCSLLRLLF